MGIFEVLSLMGGISLFLFGMNLMSEALEKQAGSKLEIITKYVTKNEFIGLFTGVILTAIIQSSSATTVMVVSFVNSGIMTLKESISVIMGANIGTTVTSWILSLAGISSSNIFIKLLKPSSFTPILAFVGVIFYVFNKDDEKKKNIGLILLGFSILMFGMEKMSDSVVGLKNIKEFQNLLIMFQNPLLGMLAGAVLTAIIQSSSASVGILQALANTGAVTYACAIPIILGQNIGTCVTAIISSIGTSVNAKRAAFLHLLFNIVGSGIFICLFLIYEYFINPIGLEKNASMMGIALTHSIFNIISTIILFPFSKNLETTVMKIIKEKTIQ